MSEPVVESVFPLGFPWQTFDPFLFCVHHLDLYPAGNEAMGPAASLAGREIGMDFEGKDGWRMYHGDVVPGFPRHPHRGFETVTLVRRGFIDHSDSLGATARFGQGDVQWMTAGRGIVHAEMFPLREREAGNPAELFQIWLNLPRADKMVDPLLHDAVEPQRSRSTCSTTTSGRATRVVTVAGALAGGGASAAARTRGRRGPTPTSRIWTIVDGPGGALDAARRPHPASGATLYFFRGGRVRVGDHEQAAHAGLAVRGRRAGRRSRTGPTRASSCSCRAARSASRWRSTARS